MNQVTLSLCLLWETLVGTGFCQLPPEPLPSLYLAALLVFLHSVVCIPTVNLQIGRTKSRTITCICAPSCKTVRGVGLVFWIVGRWFGRKGFWFWGWAKTDGMRETTGRLWAVENLCHAEKRFFKVWLDVDGSGRVLAIPRSDRGMLYQTWNKHLLLIITKQWSIVSGYWKVSCQLLSFWHTC